MPIDPAKRLARWKRNKEAERERTRTTPKPLGRAFENLVMEERDRRAAIDRGVEPIFRHSSFFKDGTWEKAIGFAADVWAAETLIKAQWGDDSATATRIATWLKGAGKDYGYTDQSLRKMIYKARERVRRLETTTSLTNPTQMIWSPCKISLVKADTGGTDLGQA